MNDLKIKLNNEGSKLFEKIGQLKLKSSKDGKFYNTDILDMKGIFRFIESVPSPKAEPFKPWLANPGSERVNISEISTKENTTKWIKITNLIKEKKIFGSINY